jgi:hypothetical protein
MGEQTPFEAMNGRKPYLGHVKVFGCLAHAKHTTPHLKKPDDRSQKLVYLGVEEGSKAHRLYDPVQRRIIISRDTIFEEGVSWDWNEVSTDDLGEFQVGGELFVDNTDWETVNVETNGEDFQPDFYPTLSAGESGGSGSVPDELQSPGIQFGAGDHADSLVNGNGDAEGLGEQSNQEMMIDDLSDEEPQHYRSLDEIYENTDIVELADSDEAEALLAESDEPVKFKDAAGSLEWMEAMNSEIRSIEKNRT